ncbi:MAG: helix-turn-helix domain-containing protein [Clostridia bacterium]|nr:helix-turn-helix domain-containing protein [Clostridia bacterium]
MEQVKIGSFIKAMRKERGLTQHELAEMLYISDKTVSKWETGNGLPDVSLMMPLCKILNISVNELLSGERLDGDQYYKKAEENIMTLMEERKREKKKLIISIIVGLIVMLSSLTLMFVASFVPLPEPTRIILIVLGFVVLIPGLIVACILDKDAGYFECKHCGHRFVPSLSAYMIGAHTLTTRHLKCPNCGKRSWCKKTLSKTNDK